ncbi:Bax inhibitor-1/YccA family protein [Terribacillus saccharophilus]|uniref:Bax inhibitor-1/YccA family protein n=1 Tax=Terribacillus saccharophilus TaxID=361277 RepID=UPI00384B426E
MNLEYAISNQKTIMQKVLQTFLMTLLLATLGIYAGNFVPPVLILPLIVVELGMLIAAFWLRRKKAVSYTFIYIFAVISGITTYPAVAYYASIGGANIVLYAFTTTFVIFGVMALVGVKSKRDFSFLGGFLFVALIALIVTGLIGIFVPYSDATMLAFSGIGSVVFSLYILYDFNQMARDQITEEMIPLMALNLYLDFINLFINLLRFLGIMSKD